jgi:hypothetical protein
MIQLIKENNVIKELPDNQIMLVHALLREGKIDSFKEIKKNSDKKGPLSSIKRLFRED